MAIFDFFGKLMPQSTWSSKSYSPSAVTGGVVNGTTANETFNIAGLSRWSAVRATTAIIRSPRRAAWSKLPTAASTRSTSSTTTSCGPCRERRHRIRDGIIGNSLANYIVGNAKSQSIEGGRGNDVLTGGGSGDSFVFGAGSGYDVITDFQTVPAPSPPLHPTPSA
jgi:Ca2+-binding RTX toxin-like protein